MHISKEIKVAVLAIVSLTILYFGFNFLNGIDFFSATNKYYTYYDNIGGLNVSDPVIINGFSVGRVSDIKIVQTNQNKVMVELDVDSDIKLNKGATATLINQDFLGSKAIELVLGGNTTEHYIDGDTLPSDVDQGLDAILEQGEKFVKDDLGSTMSRLNAILESLAGNSDKINVTLENFEATSLAAKKLMQDNQKNIAQLLENLNTTTGNLNTILVDDLKPFLTKANTFADSLNTLELGTTVQKAQVVLDDVKRTLDTLKYGQGTLGKLMHDDSLYNNLTRATANLDSLLVDIEENPGRYVHISVFGKSDKKK